MSARYEFIDESLVEIVTDPEELRERFEDPQTDAVHVIIGDPYNAAAVLTGYTREAIAEELERIAAILRGGRGISLTRDQVQAWVGHPLTDEQVVDIEECIPNSSIPDAIETITHEALRVPVPEDRACTEREESNS